ncbi:hypothetical protein [Shewanella sp. WPAGA9]|uniref:hypothetical protein n=1 Tax=Shewanella sp. ENK2 TaxID=2775245 RepID=UPI00178550BF|nr:hypothetical protein [Shewanella sp. WPAGA9]
MAFPLIWLGTAAIGAIMLADDRQQRKTIQHERRMGRAPKVPNGKSVSPLTPSIWHKGDAKVDAAPGAIVCCFVFGVIEHTGIWVGDDHLVELHGSGLIRVISAKRFLQGRTGSCIFQAGNHLHQPLVAPKALARAEQAIYQYRDYDLFTNNCHRFVWSCISGEETEVRSFEQLNTLLAQAFKQVVYWDEVALNKK